MEMSFGDQFRATWLISLIGCGGFIAGVGILLWNESKVVNIAHALEESLTACVSLNNKGDNPHWEFEGGLVHISGPLAIGEPLTEPDYGVEVLAVKLKRQVQMFQWHEETIEASYGDTVASQSERRHNYYTDWNSKLIDSSQFYIRTDHHNPKTFTMQSIIHVSETVKIGALALGMDVKKQFKTYVDVTADERPERKDIKLHSGMYYHCEDVLEPEIGDVRVHFSFSGLEGDKYTIIGQQVKGEIKPFHTLHGHSVLLMFPGDHTIEKAFEMEHADRRFVAWAYRAGGWFVLFFAATCLSSLLHVLLSRYPLARTFLSAESPFITNLALSLSLAILVSSTAWFWFRPMLGASMAAAAISPFVYCLLAMYNAAQGNVYHRL